jgi:alpha-L-fucosidase
MKGRTFVFTFSMRQRRAPIAAAACLLLLSSSALAQKKATPPKMIGTETPEQFAKRTNWWKEAKFGMFIHWGEYAVPADSSEGAAEWYFYNHTDKDPTTGARKHMQVKEYEKFAPKFNPTKFDAHQWVKTAKEAGMKYIVITSKHHDGFDMFDSKLSDYTIAKATPFKRDPMKELAVECKKQGIKFCFYHSIMDWHHPDYTPRRDWDTRPTTGANYDRYVDYMKGQLKEILTNYGPIGVLWFDGEWEQTWNHERGVDLYKYVRSLQPNILVNNRVDKGRSGMQGMNSGSQFVGDFGTPEQEIPPQGFPDGRLWESCMTMNDTWGYARNDNHWKSAETLIHNLVDIASKGGNFLLNVGPTETGVFPQAIDERLMIMGKWMDVHSSGIYATTQSPFKKIPFEGRCTTKGNTIYLHVFKWPNEGLRLEGLRTKVLSARALDGKEKLQVTSAAGSPGTVYFSRPAKLDTYATTVEVKLAGPAVVDAPVAPTIPAGAGGAYTLKAADAEVHGETARYEPDGDKNAIGYWTNAGDYVTWVCNVPAAGKYAVSVTFACENGSDSSAYMVSAGKSSVAGKVSGTGSWTAFQEKSLGTIDLPAGKSTVAVKVTSKPGYAVMNLRQVKLTPVK